METVVIYHGGCPDGTAAAWCLSLVLDNSKTYYHYGKFNDVIPDVKDKHVIFVDFTYPLEDTKKVLADARTVLVLDHHKSAEPLTSIQDPKFTLVLDMDRSGAQLAWDYAVEHNDFTHPFVCAKFSARPIPPVDNPVNPLQQSVSRPWFINDIADRDLWRWQIPGSKNTTRRMFSLNCYEHINSFYALLHSSRDQFATEGSILNAEDDKTYNSLVRNAVEMVATDLNGRSWLVKVVECDHGHASEVGNRLSSDGSCDFAVSVRYNFAKHEFWLSCRASSKSSIDLTQVVKGFDPNSGGHPKAAGMTLTAEQFTRMFQLKPAVQSV